ncbi:MAG TPA: peptide chain release factor 3 [Candidatus Xenobia bacterium]
MLQEKSTLLSEIKRRRTFAIISHPDAGKTTLTEKLLLYGGAIQLAGSVRARQNQRRAASDWMELEQKRGISITSTALEFPYAGCQINLLDTPGHQDFSEDTYRTLFAADAAVMLLDSAKGVEPQTLKLFAVCRQRGFPILTFINKMDRPGRDPFDLLDEVEKVLGIAAVPLNWPVGSGSDFKGVYETRERQLHLFDRVEHGARRAPVRVANPSDPALAAVIGQDLQATLLDDLELLNAGTDFDMARFLRGQLSPVFFGSAVTNFGVQLFLDRFVELAPPPDDRPLLDGAPYPVDEPFSGFIFKIQANMDPAHRDRIAFMRICSGRFERAMAVTHCPTGKPVRLSQAHRLFGQERIPVEEAFAGDIIGLVNPGVFSLGDSVSAGPSVAFEPIPRFAPERFALLRMANPTQRKPFVKGLEQLSEEGAIQLLFKQAGDFREAILAAIGPLQFDVVQFRLVSEYGVETHIEPLSYSCARWLREVPDALDGSYGTRLVYDSGGHPVLLFESDYWRDRFAQQNKSIALFATHREAELSRT